MSDGYTVKMPTHCDEELLPSGWHDVALEHGIGEEEAYTFWRRFKAISRWPFELRRWSAYVAKIASNRQAARAP